ncbi:hypothetical protein SAMN05443252_11072 [Bacillus sp. OV322]|nr:hypothetical protein SAMN05443252_11072 [Bacillus sp. OV322]
MIFFRGLTPFCRKVFNLNEVPGVYTVYKQWLGVVIWSRSVYRLLQ